MKLPVDSTFPKHQTLILSNNWCRLFVFYFQFQLQCNSTECNFLEKQTNLIFERTRQKHCIVCSAHWTLALWFNFNLLTYSAVPTCKQIKIELKRQTYTAHCKRPPQTMHCYCLVRSATSLSSSLQFSMSISPIYWHIAKRKHEKSVCWRLSHKCNWKRGEIEFQLNKFYTVFFLCTMRKKVDTEKSVSTYEAFSKNFVRKKIEIFAFQPVEQREQKCREKEQTTMKNIVELLKWEKSVAFSLKCY